MYMNRQRIVVAMSGGVDSSVTAKMMSDKYEVIGVTLRLHEYKHARNGCAEENIRDAKDVADKIGIRHYVLDRRQSFKEIVLKEFGEQYQKGMTPSPCITCNKTMKFGHLLRYAKEIGALGVATGHYVRKTEGVCAELHTAVDPVRDQSYFLFHLSQEELDYLMFPLGALDKKEIRKYAKAHDLCVAEKPDSQDICFVPEGEKYHQVVERLTGDSGQPGNILDKNGKVLGQHRGISHYTVGQRKGLGLADGPWFVMKIDPASNQVIVDRDVSISGVSFGRTSWLEEPSADEVVKVKVRASHEPIEARWDPHSKRMNFLQPQRGGASPGQTCSVYRGTRVLGGGWIAA